jgi:hypothetical protein
MGRTAVLGTAVPAVPSMPEVILTAFVLAILRPP